MSTQKRPIFVIGISLLMLLALSTTDFGDVMQTNPWSYKSPMPTARNLFTLCEVNGRLYAIGGSRTVTASVVTVEMYDPETDSWSEKSHLPSVECANAASVVNNKIYVFGGASRVYGSAHSATYEYDPATDSWIGKADMPTPRAYMSAGAVDGKIYVIGGTSIAGPSLVPYNTVEMYDPATDTWQKKSDMPTPRAVHTASVVGGKIYVFGGAQDGSAQGLSTVEAYDPATDTWTRKNDMPVAKCWHGTAEVGGKIYVISGGTGFETLYSSVEEYDPISDLWRIRSPMLSARWSLSTAEAGGKIYAIGGASISNDRLSLVEEYVPEAEPKGVSAVKFTPAATGAAAFRTINGEGATRAGYASIALGPGAVPYGTAVLSLRQNGVIVSEVGVPASPPTTSARVFIDYRSDVTSVPGRSESGTIDIDTGIAVANNSSVTANLTYILRSVTGSTLSLGHGSVPGGAHFACFIDELKNNAAPDFDLPPDFQTNILFGSLEIMSDVPISVLALRGTISQRGEFLMTTTPVADLTLPGEGGPIYFPEFIDGGGYTTSLILMNTSSTTEMGTLQIMDNNGNPFIVNQVGGTADSLFRYSIEPNGVFRFQTDGFPTVTKAGWVSLNPESDTSTPVGSGVFGYNPGSILVSESGIPAAVSTTHARVYIDLTGNHNTGLAVANVAGIDTTVTINAFTTDGATLAGNGPEPIPLPINGHTAAFADQFISGLPTGFTGILDISSTQPFAALTLRSLNNARGDFLMTTFPIADANRAAISPIVFPEIADGAGYVTEFVLLNTGKASQVTLSFYGEDGAPIPVGE
jgi:N-acetylneuraminic acid mutarotase